MKSETKKSKLNTNNLFEQHLYVSLYLVIDIMRNKQYPYCHIPSIKTHDGTIFPSHEILQRMTTPQTTGRYYEQKVRKTKRRRFFLFVNTF